MCSFCDRGKKWREAVEKIASEVPAPPPRDSLFPAGAYQVPRQNRSKIWRFGCPCGCTGPDDPDCIRFRDTNRASDD
jgi:hypothetical protein